MTTCQIAFSFKNRVVCIQDFSLNTPNVFQKMKASASQYTGSDAIDIVLETMSAGSHVMINSDQDAAKYIFGCAVDGRAKIKVKIARKPKKEHSKLGFKSDFVMEMPASKFVDQSFMRTVIELLDQWADVQISYDEACALVKALKAAVLQRDPLESLIETLVCALEKDELNWTIPSLLCNRYDSWTSMASEEELLYVAEQVPTILDKLVSRRGKLFEDVFIKQKSLKKILKIRLPKSKNRGRKVDQKVCSRMGETDGFNNFEEQRLRRPSPKHAEIRVPLQVKKVDFEVESSSDEEKVQKHEVNLVRGREKAKTAEEFEVVKAVKRESRYAKKEDSDESPDDEEQETEKKRKLEAKLAKRMERAGCKTAEELEVLKAVNRELRRAQALQKYGCSTEEELKQARKEERLAKQLARTGCQDENELIQLKLAKKLEKSGCKTVEELNDLKKHRRVAKPKRAF